MSSTPGGLLQGQTPWVSVRGLLAWEPGIWELEGTCLVRSGKIQEPLGLARWAEKPGVGNREGWGLWWAGPASPSWTAVTHLQQVSALEDCEMFNSLLILRCRQLVWFFKHHFVDRSVLAKEKLPEGHIQPLGPQCVISDPGSDPHPPPPQIQESQPSGSMALTTGSALPRWQVLGWKGQQTL